MIGPPATSSLVMSPGECDGHSLFPFCHCVSLSGTRVEGDKVCQAWVIFDKKKSQKHPLCYGVFKSLSAICSPQHIRTSNPVSEQQSLGGFLESALE